MGSNLSSHFHFHFLSSSRLLRIRIAMRNNDLAPTDKYIFINETNIQLFLNKVSMAKFQVPGFRYTDAAQLKPDAQ